MITAAESVTLTRIWFAQTHLIRVVRAVTEPVAL